MSLNINSASSPMVSAIAPPAGGKQFLTGAEKIQDVKPSEFSEAIDFITNQDSKSLDAMAKDPNSALPETVADKLKDLTSNSSTKISPEAVAQNTAAKPVEKALIENAVQSVKNPALAIQTVAAGSEKAEVSKADQEKVAALQAAAQMATASPLTAAPKTQSINEIAAAPVAVNPNKNTAKGPSKPEANLEAILAKAALNQSPVKQVDSKAPEKTVAAQHNIDQKQAFENSMQSSDPLQASVMASAYAQAPGIKPVKNEIKMGQNAPEMAGDFELDGLEAAPKNTVAKPAVKIIGGDDFLSSRLQFKNSSDMSKPVPGDAAQKPSADLAALMSASTLVGVKKSDGKQELENSAESKSLASLASNDVAQTQPFQVGAQAATTSMNLEAATTQNGTNQTRISHESIDALSQSINQMSLKNQGGEIRIRLNPKELGEMKLHVITSASGSVQLKIQASNDEARAVLEESVSALRESLSKHSLVLDGFDVAVSQISSSMGKVTQSESAQNNTDSQPNFQNQNSASQNNFASDGGRRFEQQDSQSGMSARDLGLARPAVAANAARMNQMNRQATANSRLDVRA